MEYYTVYAKDHHSIYRNPKQAVDAVVVEKKVADVTTGVGSEAGAHAR